MKIKIFSFSCFLSPLLPGGSQPIMKSEMSLSNRVRYDKSHQTTFFENYSELAEQARHVNNGEGRQPHRVAAATAPGPPNLDRWNDLSSQDRQRVLQSSIRIHQQRQESIQQQQRQFEQYDILRRFIQLESRWYQERHWEHMLQQLLDHEKGGGKATPAWPYVGLQGANDSPTLGWIPRCFLGGTLPDSVALYRSINDWRNHLLHHNGINQHPDIRSNWERHPQPFLGSSPRGGNDSSSIGTCPRRRRGREGRPAGVGHAELRANPEASWQGICVTPGPPPLIPAPGQLYQTWNRMRMLRPSPGVLIPPPRNITAGMKPLEYQQDSQQPPVCPPIRFGNTTIATISEQSREVLSTAPRTTDDQPIVVDSPPPNTASDGHLINLIQRAAPPLNFSGTGSNAQETGGNK